MEKMEHDCVFMSVFELNRDCETGNGSEQGSMVHVKLLSG